MQIFKIRESECDEAYSSLLVLLNRFNHLFCGIGCLATLYVHRCGFSNRVVVSAYGLTVFSRALPFHPTSYLKLFISTDF